MRFGSRIPLIIDFLRDKLTRVLDCTTGLSSTDDLTVTCATDKTLVLGTSVWNDLLPITAATGRFGTANNPDLTTWAGITVVRFTSVNDFLFGTMEVMHDYKEGTDIEFHLHLLTLASDATDRYVNYQIDYCIANIDGTMGTATSISENMLIPAFTPGGTHLYHDFSSVISGTGLQIGAYIICNITRIAQTGTAPTTQPAFLALGAHYQIDTMGSRTEHAK